MILVTVLPEADATGTSNDHRRDGLPREQRQFRPRHRRVLLRARRPVRHTIEAEIVIVAPFIYDSVRLLLLSNTDKFPQGLANERSSRQASRTISARVRGLRRPHITSTWVSAQKHTIDDFRRQLRHTGGLPWRPDFGQAAGSKAVDRLGNEWPPPPGVRAGAPAI